VPNSCDIESQQYIIQEYNHTPMSEQTLVNEAEQHGWFSPQTGTSLEDMGKLLQLHGIPTSQPMSGDITTIANELSQGHKVIVDVDAGALDKGHPDGQADHAVVVSGIDLSDPNNPQVIVSDPFTAGAEDRHPLSQFLLAWQASGDTMVSTEAPAPQSMPGSAASDPTIPHDTGSYSWDHWQASPAFPSSDPYSPFGTPDNSYSHYPAVDPMHDLHFAF